VPWEEIMPSTILTWTDSLSGASANGTLLWRGGVYASVAGYPNEAAPRLARAAELDAKYAPQTPAP